MERGFGNGRSSGQIPTMTDLLLGLTRVNKGDLGTLTGFGCFRRHCDLEQSPVVGIYCHQRGLNEDPLWGKSRQSVGLRICSDSAG